MFRFLFFADSAETLRRHALPLARHIRNRGWTADGMGQSITQCASCDAAFHKTFEPIWNRARFDPRNLLSAPKRFRQFVEREEFDVVYIASPSFGFLTRFALRNLRRMRFPRVVYAVNTPSLGLWERVALPWTDHVVTSDPYTLQQLQGTLTAPRPRVHLLPGAQYNPDSLGSARDYNKFFSQVLEIPSATRIASRRAKSGQARAAATSRS